jgi:hypothetical protein
MNLLYIDEAGGYLFGIPARPLAAEEIAAHGWDVDALIASGLYALAPAGAPFPPDAPAEAGVAAPAAPDSPHKTGPLDESQVPAQEGL